VKLKCLIFPPSHFSFHVVLPGVHYILFGGSEFILWGSCGKQLAVEVLFPSYWVSGHWPHPYCLLLKCLTNLRNFPLDYLSSVSLYGFHKSARICTLFFFTFCIDILSPPLTSPPDIFLMFHCLFFSLRFFLFFFFLFTPASRLLFKLLVYLLLGF